MLLYMYQIYSSLQSHLHFFVLFFFTFMEYFFCGHPIYLEYDSFHHDFGQFQRFFLNANGHTDGTTDGRTDGQTLI